MIAFARCPRDQEILRFAIDKIGRVFEICPVCDEGKQPTIPKQVQTARHRAGCWEERYCELDECGKSFEPNSANQKFCTEKCRDIYRATEGDRCPPPVGRCRECQNPFQPESKFQAYCSDECRQLGRSKSVSRTLALRRVQHRQNYLTQPT